MATFTIRNVPAHVHAAIKHLAAKNHRSMEAEIRTILIAIAAKENGQGLGQKLRARFAGALGDELTELRDPSPIEGPAFD